MNGMRVNSGAKALVLSSRSVVIVYVNLVFLLVQSKLS